MNNGIDVRQKSNGDYELTSCHKNRKIRIEDEPLIGIEIKGQEVIGRTAIRDNISLMLLPHPNYEYVPEKKFSAVSILIKRIAC